MPANKLLIIFLPLALLVACSAQQGPAGPSGPQSTAGPQGPTGGPPANAGAEPRLA
jgi:hypothetical protein